MFDSKYKEALENMKLRDSFKAGLLTKMKNAKKTSAPGRRLVLAVVAGVLVVSTSVALAANAATDGRLFRSMFVGNGYFQTQTTAGSSSAVTPAEVPTVTPTVTPTAAPAGKPTLTPTDVPEATPAVPAVTAAAAPTSKPAAQPTAALTGRTAPSVSANAGNDCVVVSWNKITNTDLVGYKVVASGSDSAPMYSENGYYAWITDAGTTSCTIHNGDGYTGGDVGTFSGGTSYYFSVTAIYGDEWQKIAGNAVQVTMPGDPVPLSDAVGRIAPSVNAVPGDNCVVVT